ncbi:MAG: crossover junction endodeoxyribonuclease RuvC [Acidobacteria bacterium]|nr:crossover junction endodeoxyribonuclease RuvC [Acidobacteriota bacterium]
MTGYAVLEKRGAVVKVLAHGALHSPASGSFPSRLLHMADALGAVLDEARPDEAAVEDLFHAVNARSALQLAHARGALVVEIARRGIPLFAYAPLAVKKAVTGAGRADKVQVRSMIERLLGIRLGDAIHDVSDALAVALCHANTRRGPGA